MQSARLCRSLALMGLTVTLMAVPTAAAGGENPYGHLPISIRVDVAASEAGDGRTYLDEVTKAAEYWATGGNGALAFEPEFRWVPPGEGADIVVHFQREPLRSCGLHNGPALGCGGPGGVTLVTMLPTGEDTVDHLPRSTMLLLAKHELGHALGLRHSVDEGDIMFEGGIPLYVAPGGLLTDEKPLPMGLVGLLGLLGIGAFILLVAVVMKIHAAIRGVVRSRRARRREVRVDVRRQRSHEEMDDPHGPQYWER